jgi:hypothetical protein
MTILDISKIGIVIVIALSVFNYLSLQRIDYIREYKKVSLLFLLNTFLLLILFFNSIKVFFSSFEPLPIFLLLLLYVFLFSTYKFMRKYTDFRIIEKLESKNVYFASISYRYIIYKSFDILFQQIALLCILTSLRDFNLPYISLGILFSLSFAVGHLFMIRKGIFIGLLFIISAFFGGLIFPILLLDQYGIFYTFIVHWLFYILLGVITHIGRRTGNRMVFAL